mgnify:CR=1 FL=1
MSCLASDEMLSCTSCSLHTTRTQVVPGHGSIDAKIAFVAEAPGRDEDTKGEPLVGSAGQRFDRQLERVGIKREDVWLDNAVHCRPPNNAIRDYPDALARCPDLWLFPTLYALDSLRVIVALGATAGCLWFPGAKATEVASLARAFQPTARSCRSEVLRPYIVVGAFHPSYALRSGGEWNEIDASIVGSLQRALTYSSLLEVVSK